MNETEHYIDLFVSPNGLDSRLEHLKVDQRGNTNISQLIKFVEGEWPVYLILENTLLKPYFDRKSLLSMSKGF